MALEAVAAETNDKFYFMNIAIEAACEIFKITEQELYGPGRKQTLSRPRQMIWKLVRDNSKKVTFAQIATRFNRKSSNIILGLRSLDKHLREDRNAYWTFQTFGEKVIERLVEDGRPFTEPTPGQSAPPALEASAGFR